MKLIKNVIKHEAPCAAVVSGGEIAKLLLGVARLVSRLPEQRKLLKVWPSVVPPSTRSHPPHSHRSRAFARVFLPSLPWRTHAPSPPPRAHPQRTSRTLWIMSQRLLPPMPELEPTWPLPVKDVPHLQTPTGPGVHVCGGRVETLGRTLLSREVIAMGGETCLPGRIGRGQQL